MAAKDIHPTIQIVNGNFSPFEASDLLNELIRSRINYHKIQMLRMWEGDHRFDSQDWDQQVEEIIKEKSEALDLITKAKKEGLRIEITGNIGVRLSK